MSFKSVNKILDVEQIKKKCQENPFIHLLNCWEETLGSAIANHAQPVSIQRNVLWVATSSSAWSQNLTLKRRHILSKLNKVLSYELSDIRFSTSGWQYKNNFKQSKEDLSLKEHPSYVEGSPKDFHNGKILSFTELRKEPKDTFSRWEKQVKARSQNLPLCKTCKCPTPIGEIKRWGCCALCAVKKL